RRARPVRRAAVAARTPSGGASGGSALRGALRRRLAFPAAAGGGDGGHRGRASAGGLAGAERTPLRLRPHGDDTGDPVCLRAVLRLGDGGGDRSRPRTAGGRDGGVPLADAGRG